MDIEKIVFDAMEDVLGLEGLEESRELNLLAEGLVDSLAAVSLIDRIEVAIGVNIDVSQMTPKDFTTVDNIIAAVKSRVLSGR
jgi:acyl carrier protein